MTTRVEVAALVELMVGCQSKLIGNKRQSQSVIARILAIMSLLPEDSTDWGILYALFAQINGFLAQFINKSYFINTWMSNNDNIEFISFYKKMDAVTDSLNIIIPFDPMERIEDATVDADELVVLIETFLSGPGSFNTKNKAIADFLTINEQHIDISKLPALRTVNPTLLAEGAATPISNGKFGIVHKNLLRGVPVAVKCLSLLNKDDSDETTAEKLEMDMYREALILQLYDIEGVIRYIGADDAIRPKYIYLELAMCSLHDTLFVSKYKGVLGDLTLARKLSMIATCCSTFSRLHAFKIIHRDITSRNILLCSDGSLKVTDFGLTRSKLFVHSAGVTPKGTHAYMAPELLMYAEQYNYSEATDMYAFTIMMNEILTEIEPFNITSAKLIGLMYRSEGKERPIEYSGECAGSIVPVLHLGWHSNAKDRLTFEQLSTHLKMIQAVNDCEDLLNVPSTPSNIVKSNSINKNNFNSSSLSSESDDAV